MQVHDDCQRRARSPARSSPGCYWCTSSATSSRLTGTHWGCDTSNCGVCVVWMDGVPVKSCTVLAAMADGREVRTVEGLEQDGELDPVQQGFMNEHGLQCGFCTPGMMMTARGAARRQPAIPPRPRSARPSPGQLCRCTGYENIVRAIRWAADHPRCRSRDRVSAYDHDDDSAHEPRPQSASAGGSRKEDARFLRGRGQYVDDVNLPGMLHGAVLRSPYAHARIVSIDTSRRRGPPQGEGRHHRRAARDSEALAWIPSLSHDVVAVLATDKVRFQGQEVAFVVAEDRYAARDALELIDVDYEALPAGRRRDEGARPGRAGHPRRHRGQDRQPHLRLGGRRRGDDRRGVRARPTVVVTQDVLYPRVHPAPLETCGAVADMDKVTGKLTIWCTTQAPARPPHALRARGRPARAQDPGDQPRHRRRVRQQGRHLPRLRAVRRRLDRHRQAR